MNISKRALGLVFVAAQWGISPALADSADPLFPWLTRGMLVTQIPKKVSRPFKLIDRCQLDEKDSPGGTGIRKAFEVDGLDCKSVVMKDLLILKEGFEVEFIRTQKARGIVAVFAFKGSKEVPEVGFTSGQALAQELSKILVSRYSTPSTTPLKHYEAGIQIEGFYSQWKSTDWNITLSFLGSRNTDNYAIMLTYISDPKAPFKSKK
jgi:hypothetical protein